MASIHIRCNKWWGSWRDASGNQYNRSSGMQALEENRDAAQAWADNEERKARAQGQDAPGKAESAAVVGAENQKPTEAKPDPSIREYFTTWAASAGRYRQNLPWVLNAFLDYLGKKADRPLSYLSKAHIEGFKAHLLRRNRNASTVNHYICFIRSGCQNAVKMGLLVSSPVQKQDYLETKTTFTRSPFSVEGISALLNATKQLDWITAILLGFYCRLELSEILTRVWDHVDFNERTIVVPRSLRAHAKDRTVYDECRMPLHSILFDHLKKCNLRAQNRAHLTASFAEFDPHTIKVGFANLMVKAQLPVKQIESAAGHKFWLTSFGSIGAAHLKLVGVQIQHNAKLRNDPLYEKQMLRIVRHLLQADADWMDDYKSVIDTLPNLKTPDLPCLR